MVHSVSGWTRGVQVKLWDPLRTRAIPERLRGVITTRCYTNPRLPCLTLPAWCFSGRKWRCDLDPTQVVLAWHTVPHPALPCGECSNALIEDIFGTAVCIYSCVFWPYVIYAMPAAAVVVLHCTLWLISWHFQSGLWWSIVHFCEKIVAECN